MGLFFKEIELFRNLQQKFDGRTDFPIEIQEICDALIEMGFQDDIRVVGEEMDTTNLLGAYAQWRESNGLYQESTSVSLIIYPTNVPLYVQRLICAKELVHVCDKDAAKVKDADEILELARVVSGTVEFGGGHQIAKLKVATDVLASSQAQMLLFPKAARLIARQKINAEEIGLDQLVEKVQLPEGVVVEMLNPEWEETAELLKNI